MIQDRDVEIACENRLGLCLFPRFPAKSLPRSYPPPRPFAPSLKKYRRGFFVLCGRGKGKRPLAVPPRRGSPSLERLPSSAGTAVQIILAPLPGCDKESGDKTRVSLRSTRGYSPSSPPGCVCTPEACRARGEGAKRATPGTAIENRTPKGVRGAGYMQVMCFEKRAVSNLDSCSSAGGGKFAGTHTHLVCAKASPKLRSPQRAARIP